MKVYAVRDATTGHYAAGRIYDNEFVALDNRKPAPRVWRRLSDAVQFLNSFAYRDARLRRSPSMADLAGPERDLEVVEFELGEPKVSVRRGGAK